MKFQSRWKCFLFIHYERKQLNRSQLGKPNLFPLVSKKQNKTKKQKMNDHPRTHNNQDSKKEALSVSNTANNSINNNNNSNNSANNDNTDNNNSNKKSSE